MSELQATVEFSIELCNFYNVDLFQRGCVRPTVSTHTCTYLPYIHTYTSSGSSMCVCIPSTVCICVCLCRCYQVRCGVRTSPKQPAHVEVSVPGLGHHHHRDAAAAAAAATVTASSAGSTTTTNHQGAPPRGAASRTFHILYRSEEVRLHELMLFRYAPSVRPAGHASFTSHTLPHHILPKLQASNKKVGLGLDGISLPTSNPYVYVFFYSSCVPHHILYNNKINLNPILI